MLVWEPPREEAPVAAQGAGGAPTTVQGTFREEFPCKALTTIQETPEEGDLAAGGESSRAAKEVQGTPWKEDLAGEEGSSLWMAGVPPGEAAEKAPRKEARKELGEAREGPGEALGEAAGEEPGEAREAPREARGEARKEPGEAAGEAAPRGEARKEPGEASREAAPREELRSGEARKEPGEAAEKVPREELRSGEAGEAAGEAAEKVPREELRAGVARKGPRGEWTLEEIASVENLAARLSGGASPARRPFRHPSLEELRELDTVGVILRRDSSGHDSVFFVMKPLLQLGLGGIYRELSGSLGLGVKDVNRVLSESCGRHFPRSPGAWGLSPFPLFSYWKRITSLQLSLNGVQREMDVCPREAILSLVDNPSELPCPADVCRRLCFLSGATYSRGLNWIANCVSKSYSSGLSVCKLETDLSLASLCPPPEHHRWEDKRGVSGSARILAQLGKGLFCFRRSLEDVRYLTEFLGLRPSERRVRESSVICAEVLGALERGERAVLVTGPAGSGKTHLLSALYKASHDCQCASFTGKAVEVMLAAGLGGVSTLHRRVFGRMRTPSLLLVDEISMISLGMLREFLESEDFSSTRFVFCGDENQLPPVEGLSALRELRDNMTHFHLTGNYRAREELLLLSRRVLEGGFGEQTRNIRFASRGRRSLLSIKEELSRSRAIVLCPTNSLCAEVNELLCPRHDSTVGKSPSRGKMAPGAKVMIIKNSRRKGRGYFNGEQAVLLRRDRGSREALVRTGAGDEKRVPLASLSLAYAITIHKSQGSEWDNVVLYLGDRGPRLSRELLYTAVTRAKRSFIVVAQASSDIGELMRRAAGRREHRESLSISSVLRGAGVNEESEASLECGRMWECEESSGDVSL